MKAAVVACASWSINAALPAPLLDLPFSEGTGLTTTNAGSLGGVGDLVLANDLPTFSTNIPTGPFAPAGNTQAIDFGTIAAGQGNRAIDFATGPDGTLGPLPAFTLSGWLNPRDLTVGAGGNRVLFALESGNGPGLDLVQQANGSLRIGINQWPDGANGGGPASSSAKLRANAQAASSNWVFFAVTYDPLLPERQLKYYFGNGNQLASLDSAHDYLGGLAETEGRIDFSGPPTIGNFGPNIGARTEMGPTSSRVFRGLMDELKIYNAALDLAGVQSVQLNGAVPDSPVVIQVNPTAQTVFAGQAVTLAVRATGAAPLRYQWQRANTDIPDATNDTYVLPSAALTDNGVAFRVVVSNASSSTNSAAATLTVVEDNGHKVSLSFSEAGTVTNRGNLGGAGTFALANGFPVISPNVPSGAFAPTQNSSSVNFGMIAAGQGSRAIDFTNQFGGTLGPMQAFTVSGWLNTLDLAVGPGGNRITFALSAANGPGFDLVQLADGSLQLGVNQWPDGSPAQSGPILTADPAAGADNWVFFAVTYDGTLQADNVSFYVGKGGEAAQLQSTVSYDRGPIVTPGALTAGNFGRIISARTEAGANSRVFRGLMDELNIFSKILSASEIAALQKAPAYTPPQVDPIQITQEPADVVAFDGQSASFTVSFTGTPPFAVQWQKGGSALTGETNQSLNLTASLADNNADFRAIISNAAGSATSRVARLTVKTDSGRKVGLSFSEATGTSTQSSGDLAGTGLFVQTDGFPIFSTNVPAGQLAPTNNASSVDFGSIEDGQGGRAIDFTNAFGNTLGNFDSFTITGWLNSRDLRVGSGGNRIVFALAQPNGPGFDLVQMPDGSLQLGVNQWPDNTPARSSALITEDPDTGPNNWVFFAVTYDGAIETGNVQFYFGNAGQAAAPDPLGPIDYNRGPITTSGILTVGNFGSNVTARVEVGSGASRVFRGLLDEINIFNKVLSIEEITAAQKSAGATPIPGAPQLSISRTENQIAVSWDSTGSPFQLQGADRLVSGQWTNITTVPSQVGTRSTVTLPIGTGTQFFRLFGN